MKRVGEINGVDVLSGKVLFTVIVCVFLMLTTCDAVAADAVVGDIFVAADGNDSNPGTLDRPLASFVGARDAVRQRLASGETADITVLFRGGVYAMLSPVTFGPADSAKDRQTITYGAYPGETPIFSGGKRITGWTKQGNVWTANIPEARDGKWPFRRLYAGNSRRTLARIPNDGEYFRMAAPVASSPDRAFRCALGDVRDWPHLLEANVVGLIKWESYTIPIEKFDARSNTLTMAGSVRWDLSPALRYFVENLPEALDAPGEWHLDREKGLLSYIPMADEDMERTELIAPVVTSFLRVQGDRRAGLVHRLKFTGLHFRHGDYVLPADGMSNGQGEAEVPAVVTFADAKDCVFDRNEISCIGTHAIEVAAGCSGIRIEQNEMHDLGAGGVKVREGSRATTIHNNFIHDGGCVYYGGTPVFIQNSSDNVVSHNEICDFNWVGISVGWSWGFNPTQCHNNKIEYNYLHHLGRGATTDIGAIYTLGISTGTVIRNNLIHHVWDCPEGYLACGIYPDEGSSGLLIENNVIYQTAWGGLHVHYGRDNIVRNNIFAFGRTAQIQMGREKRKDESGAWRDITTSSMTFERNIVFYDRGELFRRDTELVADNNVYWNTAGPVIFPNGADLPAWQARGRDAHSVIADPKFVDAAGGDFSLRPDSPALALGFKPIDTREIGLTGDAAWVAKPRAIKRAPVTIPPRWNPLVVSPLDDDFEKTEAGDFPQHGQVRRAGRTSIAVSDQAAASGKHSLKFQDAKGNFANFLPYLEYVLDARSGLARASFDLRLEKGAMLAYEWRDTDASPYIVGPSLSTSADGSLLANDVKLMELPTDQWVHLSIECPLGNSADGTYTLVVTLPGKPPRTFNRLAYAPRFKQATWLSLSSIAADARVFYVDNLKFACP